GLETISDPSSCVDRGPAAGPGISSDVYRTHGSAAALAPETDVVVDERALADAHVAGGRIADELTASHEDGPHCAARGRMAITPASAIASVSTPSSNQPLIRYTCATAVSRTDVWKSTVVPPSVPSARLAKRLVRTTVPLSVVPIAVQPGGGVTVAHAWFVNMA